MRLVLLSALLVAALPAPAAQPTPSSRRDPAMPPSTPSLPATTLAAFQASAKKFHSAVALPQLETTPDQIKASVTNTIARANRALDAVAAAQGDTLTFARTVGALDDLGYEVGLTANRLQLLKETSTNAAVRDAATDAAKELSEWSVGTEYREDVYQAVQRFADRKPALEGEQAKLLKEVLRDYKRAGLTLPKAGREEVERLRKELTRLVTDYEANVTKAAKALKFSKTELEGVPQAFLDQKGVKTGEDEYTVMVNITFHYMSVMDNAKRESTRKRVLVEHDNLARAENTPLLQKILELRDRIATKLGYASWADYQIEPKMAKTAARAREFCEELQRGLQPKFAAEVEEFRRIKARETGDENAKINVWDWRYYNNQLKKEKYTVDTEALRVFFPYERCLAGMFNVYQSIFGLRFERMEAPAKWCEDLELYAVSDSKTGEPLGCFYLDMFPREGKYHHFAQFGLIEGKQLPGGDYQRPTVALVCNFPPPAPGKPSLLSHGDVETLFHEFGHAMHSILTRAKVARFAGTSVPRDFVEAPSQMLEFWVWDKTVLDSFAGDYRDPSKKVPAETLEKMKAAKLATSGAFYRRQLSFALTDLALHTRIQDGAGTDAVQLANQVLGDVFLPMAPDTAFVCYFGHLMGYDAGYYGYAWAEAIAADMATVFEKSPLGFQDTAAGRRLRDEIYAVGDTRDATESIEKFLGRKQSVDPFLKKVGIGK